MEKTEEEAVKLLVTVCSESHGFSAEEGIHLLLNWRRNDWLKLIDEAVVLCMQCYEEDDTIGPISKEEAKKLLLNVYGEKDEIPRLISERRKVKVRRRTVMLLTGVSWRRSAFIFRLMEDGIDATVEELLQVTRENLQYTYDECRKFFQHECQTCFGKFSLNAIHVGLLCGCEICMECYINHIDNVISEKHIRHLVCPICLKPDINDPSFETKMYYAMMSAEIQHFIENGWLKQDMREIFNNKLLDFHLKKQENFRYCINCKNGFLWEDINQITMQCNLCNVRMCFLCKEKWMDQHDDTSCEDFKAWKEANDPERQALGVQAFLQGRQIECPACMTRFELADGGCMHFLCFECKYAFCIGCNNGFKRDGQCQVDVSCQGKGMHTHHPRDCLYYIRDMEVKDLETLLTNHQIQWEKDYPPDMEGNENVCGVTLQKKTEAGGLEDGPCGEVAPVKMAGVCKKHYKEYLIVLINNNGIDLIEVMDINEMKNELKRNFKEALPKNNGESDDQFKQRLKTYLLKELPLQVRAGRRNVPIIGEQPMGAAAAAAAAVNE